MKRKCSQLKLTIELVPRSSWCDNLRKYVKKKDWNVIRARTYARWGHRCGVCKRQGRLECHEVWQYNDNQHSQKLTDFIALCSMCDHVKHIGLAAILAQQGRLDYGKVVAHFCAVNACAQKTFDDCREEAFEKWEERSLHDWCVDLGPYKGLVVRPGVGDDPRNGGRGVAYGPGDLGKVDKEGNPKIPIMYQRNGAYCIKCGAFLGPLPSKESSTAKGKGVLEMVNRHVISCPVDLDASSTTTVEEGTFCIKCGTFLASSAASDDEISNNLVKHRSVCGGSRIV